MRVARLTALLAAGAFLVGMSVLACSKKSYSDAPGDDGGGDDASGDDTGSSIGMVLGDDGGLDVYEFFETSTPDDAGPCTIASGAYTVTGTPTDDSGAQCIAWTSTVTPPGPSPEAGDPVVGPCLGGPGTGYWTPDGPLPVCALDFTCTSDNGDDMTMTAGSVEVYFGTYAGTAQTQVYSDFDAGKPLYTCTFHLDYTLQQ
ncbi:MAG: hypothetical protein ABSE49_12985 [Polyangiaceae bacterium]|jgi:hypothetical protein